MMQDHDFCVGIKFYPTRNFLDRVLLPRTEDLGHLKIDIEDSSIGLLQACFGIL